MRRGEERRRRRREEEGGGGEKGREEKGEKLMCKSSQFPPLTVSVPLLQLPLATEEHHLQLVVLL